MGGREARTFTGVIYKGATQKISVALKALLWFSPGSPEFRRFFCRYSEPGGDGAGKRFLEKLKKGSHRATGGGGAPRDTPPGLIKPRSPSKVNKPGGVRLRRRVGKDRGGKGRDQA